MSSPAVATELRPRFTRALAGQHGRLVHRVGSIRAYWRHGEITGIYVTWRCGITSVGEPIPAEIDVTCCNCLRLEGRHR